MMTNINNGKFEFLEGDKELLAEAFSFDSRTKPEVKEGLMRVA